MIIPCRYIKELPDGTPYCTKARDEFGAHEVCDAYTPELPKFNRKFFHNIFHYIRYCKNKKNVTQICISVCDAIIFGIYSVSAITAAYYIYRLFN